MNKKFILFSAALAAVATFTGCSSEDDLVAQEPVVEEPVEEVKGTPFKIVASIEGATRATMYNANAWDGTNSTTWVSNIKVWGKQSSVADPWMNDVVFTRTAHNADWTASRDAAGNISKLVWPADDKETDADEREITTNFYAITDNAIKGQSDNNALEGVSKWMNPTVGQFVYTMPKIEASNEEDDRRNITWSEDNSYDFSAIATNQVDASKVYDLMTASATKKESETTSGTLPLAFTHALAGLTIKAKFVNADGRRYYDDDEEDWVGYLAKIKGIKVCGLNTAGTYTIGTGWDKLNTTDYCYYKDLSTLNITLNAEETLTTVVTLVDKGEWLVIPQTTTGWDMKTNKSYSSLNNAYIGIYIEDENETNLVLYYPLAVTFNPGKNKVITIEIGDGRDVFSDTDLDGFADYQFEPSQAGE